MGSTEEQLTDEIRILPQEERTQLITSGVLTATRVIYSENALALKADLVIPWNKFRALRMYTS